MMKHVEEEGTRVYLLYFCAILCAFVCYPIHGESQRLVTMLQEHRDCKKPVGEVQGWFTFDGDDVV